MSCDAVVTEVHRATAGMGGPGDQTNGHGGVRRRSGGAVLDVGRARRTVSGRLRTALEVRDEGRCRFPGCSSTRCDAHHVEHWSRGGETKLGNLVLLCRFHHRAVHEGGFKVAVVGGRLGTGSCVVFWRPDGQEVLASPPVEPLEAVGAGALERLHGHQGIGPETGMPRGRGGAVDYGWALMAMRVPSASPTLSGLPGSDHDFHVAISMCTRTSTLSAEDKLG